MAAWPLERLEAYGHAQQAMAIQRSRIDALRSADGRRWRTHETWGGERVEPALAPNRGVLRHSIRPRLQGGSCSAWSQGALKRPSAAPGSNWGILRRLPRHRCWRNGSVRSSTMAGEARATAVGPCALSQAQPSRRPILDAPWPIGWHSGSASMPGGRRRRRRFRPCWILSMCSVPPPSCGFPCRIRAGRASFSLSTRPISPCSTRGGTSCGRWRAKAAAWKRGSTCVKPLRRPRETGTPIGILLSGVGGAGIGRVGRLASRCSQKQHRLGGCTT